MKIEIQLPVLADQDIDFLDFMEEQGRFVLEELAPGLFMHEGSGMEKHIDEEDMKERLAWDRESGQDVAALRRIGEKLIRIADYVEKKWKAKPPPSAPDPAQ